MSIFEKLKRKARLCRVSFAFHLLGVNKNMNINKSDLDKCINESCDLQSLLSSVISLCVGAFVGSFLTKRVTDKKEGSEQW